MRNCEFYRKHYNVSTASVKLVHQASIDLSGNAHIIYTERSRDDLAIAGMKPFLTYSFRRKISKDGCVYIDSVNISAIDVPYEIISI